MRLSETAIQEFKTMYKEEYGQELSDTEAQEAALRVLRFFRIILRPLPHPPQHNHELCEEENVDKSA
jgi:hypothetical protein